MSHHEKPRVSVGEGSRRRREHLQPGDNAGCAGKVHYTARHVAEAALEALTWRDPDFGRLHPYECSDCGEWHLGH